MKIKKQPQDEYSVFKSKLTKRFVMIPLIAIPAVSLFYTFVWYGRGGDVFVNFLYLLNGDYDSAWMFYDYYLRGNKDVLLIIAIFILFIFMLRFLFKWITGYFNDINRGIDALLEENDREIQLPEEMLPMEKKLNAVKGMLAQRARETRLAEQRKNELVMYLAHDIRTPLTSIIGYLSLLEEAPDIPAEQRAKYVNITLNKAYRLEKMVNEFFEITRFNSQQITVSTEPIDLYYMLVQLLDELAPILSANANYVTLNADENITIYGDADKLARVFGNIIKNASTYSYPDTELLVRAETTEESTVITFQNKGRTIPKEKLDSIFEKFYRLDDARTSHTGGSGLGLAIAKEIVTLHGGSIRASSENETITFTVVIPIPEHARTGDLHTSSTIS